MKQSQKVLVAGTGVRGISAASLILERGGEADSYTHFGAHETGRILVCRLWLEKTHMI